MPCSFWTGKYGLYPAAASAFHSCGETPPEEPVWNEVCPLEADRGVIISRSGILLSYEDDPVSAGSAPL